MSETQIHIAIVNYLALVLPQALVWHCPNGGARSKREAGEFKRMGVLPGVPDLAILTPDAKLHFLEIKAAKGSLSPAQRAFLAFCKAAGVNHAVVRSVDETRAALALWGVSTREATP